MSLLSVSALSFGYSDILLFSDVSFELNEGEHVGLIGGNGTGKSTLLKLLLGQIVPDSGAITWHTGKKIGFIDQYSEIDRNSSVLSFLRTAFNELREIEKHIFDLYASNDEKDWNQAAALQEHLQSSEYYNSEVMINRVSMGLGLTGIGLNRKIKTLSGGQRTRCILAKLLLEHPDILLLDEPTNYLDSENINWLSEYLLQFDGAFVVVSHDTSFLGKITRYILSIDNGTVTKYKGTLEDYERMRIQSRDRQELMYQAQQKEIRKLENYISQNKAKASTAGMARSREKQLRRMKRIAPPSKEAFPEFHFPYMQMADVEKLVISDLQIGYSYPILDSFSLRVSHEKIAIIGFNGAGKSTLFRTLMGIIPPLGGRYEFKKGVRIGYCPQDSQMEASGDRTLDWLMAHSNVHSQNECRKALAKCGISSEQCQLPINRLSGGELNRVRLCLLTLRGTNLLLLDEPTNHLDVLAQRALCKGIADYPGAVLLASHDKPFYDKCCDVVVDISQLSRENNGKTR